MNVTNDHYDRPDPYFPENGNRRREHNSPTDTTVLTEQFGKYLYYELR
jgi:hypothetical protein